MPPNRCRCIRDTLTGSAGQFLLGSGHAISTAGLLYGSTLGGRLPELADRVVLLAAKDQLAAAAALIELDGIAGRILICPPGLSDEDIASVCGKGGAEYVVSDHALEGEPGRLPLVVCSPSASPAEPARRGQGATEWVLLTSGTTGSPKMIVHTLETLTGAIKAVPGAVPGVEIVWGTFYDIRRYGGLQIFLRAMLGGRSLVLSGGDTESPVEHLLRLAGHGVTHLTGTPSHWRRALMTPQARAIQPRYVRLSGEIADQAILNALHAFYPDAAIGHAFASTEAGVAFEVNDGLAGFPAGFVNEPGAVQMKVEGDSLRIRSNRMALRYLDGIHGSITADDGFVDTGDMVELREGRYHFLGRRNGVINVGGLKVYPEEVESVINRHPAVRMSMVRPRRNPVMGALVCADVVPSDSSGPGNTDLAGEILDICRQHLPRYKVPVSVRCVAQLEIAAAGKLARGHA